MQQPQNLTDVLRANPYPGRGIVIGRNAVYYWIMGRSSNSRNRVFVKTEDGIRTEAHDPSKLEDPSLIIYHPVRSMGTDLVVTNGDQTDTIVEHGDFRAALMTRRFEPDGPNFTPRISAIVHADGSFELSILKRQDAGVVAGDAPAVPADGGRCLREFYCYEDVEEGMGYLLTTYDGDGNPLPSFSGEPRPVRMAAPDEVWAALNADNKVSLYANIDGAVKLFNKNLGD